MAERSASAADHRLCPTFGLYPPSDPATRSGYFVSTAAAIGRRGGRRTTFLSPAASCRCASLTMSWSRNPRRAASCSRTARTSATTGSVSIVDLQKFLRSANDRGLEPHSTTNRFDSRPEGRVGDIPAVPGQEIFDTVDLRELQ